MFKPQLSLISKPLILITTTLIKHKISLHHLFPLIDVRCTCSLRGIIRAVGIRVAKTDDIVHLVRTATVVKKT